MGNNIGEVREKEFEDGELTRLAEEQTYLFDYKDEEVYKYGAKYIEELSENNFFVDYLKKYISTNRERIIFNGDIESLDDIFLFLKECYAREGIKGDRGKGKDSYNPSLVKKWIYESMVPSREEAHRLCFCLGMDVRMAEEFLLKGCLTKPFNYKDIKEATYYFALNNNLGYREAIEMISDIENNKSPEGIDIENDTIAIGEAIKKIDKKDEFINYINENKIGFAKQSRTAMAKLDELMKQASKLAEWEREKYLYIYNFPKIEGEHDVPAIMNVILGYESRAQEKKENIYKVRIAKSNFPSLVRNNFPDVQAITSILKSDEPSVETLRKAIVLLAFYNYFTELLQEEIEYDGSKYCEFIDYLDAILQDCGYHEMYWRNPYDWMFGYCAGSDRPIEEFRSLIQYFYLDNPEVFSKGDGDLS